MRLLITHLTRMKAPYVCLAGLDDQGNHIRPVLRHQIHRDQLATASGRIGLGSLVDFGRMHFVGRAPEVEDYLFQPEDVRIVGTVAGADLWRRLGAVADDSPSALFGPELTRTGRTYALPSGQGSGSLGVLGPTTLSKLHVNEYGKLRAELDVDGQLSSLPVTDLRMWSADHASPDETVVARMAAAVQRERPVLLAVGVGRAADVRDDGVERHWMQVNNFYLGPR